MGALWNRNGIWYVDTRIQGKRIRKSIGKYKRVAELALKDMEIKAQRNDLGFIEQKNIALSDFFKKYSDFSRINHRPATQARYRSVIQHFVTFMTQHEPNIALLKSLKVEQIEKYKAYRRNQLVPRNGCYGVADGARLGQKGAKAYTVNFEVLTLRTIFNYAIQMNYLQTNPAKGVHKLKTDDAQRRRFLTEEECHRLLAGSSEEYYPILYTFMNTGMRRGELVHLEWSDVDFAQKTLIIRRKPFWQPKSGEREIPLNDGLLNVLKGLSRGSNFVFCDHMGRRLDPNRVRD